MITISFDISFKESHILNDFILRIIEPTFSKFSKIEFDKNFEKFQVDKLANLTHTEYEQITMFTKEECEIWVQKLNNSLPRVCLNNLEYSKFISIKKSIESFYLDEIVFIYISENIEKMLQNSERVNGWQLFDRILPSNIQIIPNPFSISERDKQIISLESLPGHSHQMNYDDLLSFGCSWQMYFSPIFYKYIPKPLFDEFNLSYENFIFKNGLRRITLHENLTDYEKNENRLMQWAFRRNLGVDSIAHELTKGSNRIEPENLPVEITKENCEKGQTRVTRFLDENEKLISSNLAKKKEMREYLDDGITVVLEKVEKLN